MGSARIAQVAHLPDGPIGMPRVHCVGLAVIVKHGGRSRSAVVEPLLLRMVSHRDPAGWSTPERAGPDPNYMAPIVWITVSWW
jgi:hypothetical protein